MEIARAERGGREGEVGELELEKKEKKRRVKRRTFDVCCIGELWGTKRRAEE